MALAPSWLRDLAGAWVFYSVLPPWPWPSASFGRIARFAPFVGLVLGGLQVGVWWLLQGLGWSPAATIPVLIVCGLWSTGGLHSDGVMDTADGLSAGRARCLEAMDDSRVGASGVLAFAVVVLLKIAALASLAERLPGVMPLVLCSAGFWGRCAPLWAMLRFPYLREQGTAGFHRAQAKGLREGWPALVIVAVTLAVSVPLGWGPLLSFTLLVGMISSVAVAEGLGRRLGGHTGDSYGASVVWTEVLTLGLLALMIPLLARLAG